MFDTAKLDLPPGGAPGLAGAMWRTATGRIGLGLVGLVLAAAVVGPLLAPGDPWLVSGPSLSPPSGAHLLGTDALGRDLLSGVLWGARTSVLIAVLVGAIALAVGTGVGLVAGYAGGWLDHLLMRLTEFFQVVPRFLIALLVMALFGNGLDRLVLVLGLTSWPLLARVVRAEVLVLRECDFVRAAEAAGASRWRVMTRELLPNLLAPALVVVGLLLGQILLLEAMLAFLGLGPPNLMSWGRLAGEGQELLRAGWWVPLFPGLAITLAVLGVNLTADALTAALRGKR